MKCFKRLSFVLSISLLAGIITFSACKKDEDSEAIGVKAAVQMCNCLTEMEDSEDEEDMAGFECMLDFYNKYGKYFNSDFDFDSEFTDINNITDVFTDADFGKGFIAESLKCQLSNETE